MPIRSPTARRPSRARRLAIQASVIALTVATMAPTAAALAPPPIPPVAPLPGGPAPTPTPTPPSGPPPSGTPAPAAPTTPATSALGPPIVWGIGDQHPYFFKDPRWRQLPLRHVRYFVPWDLMNEPAYLRYAGRWLALARARGTVVLVAITQSDLRGRSHYLPGRREYRRAVARIMRRYWWVHEWTPWNEANLALQSTLRRPAMAVRYWRVMLTLCHRCTVTSPSIVGYTHNAPRGWMRAFVHAARGLHGPWAIHLYNDINEFHPYALNQLEHQLPPGPIWVTEVGGWKHFNGFPTNLRRQTRAVTYLFHLAPLSWPRVVRWYLYQWTGSPPGFRWDSGLVELRSGKARPALRVVQRALLGSGASPLR